MWGVFWKKFPWWCNLRKYVNPPTTSKLHSYNRSEIVPMEIWNVHNGETSLSSAPHTVSRLVKHSPTRGIHLTFAAKREICKQKRMFLFYVNWIWNTTWFLYVSNLSSMLHMLNKKKFTFQGSSFLLKMYWVILNC